MPSIRDWYSSNGRSLKVRVGRVSVGVGSAAKWLHGMVALSALCSFYWAQNGQAQEPLFSWLKPDSSLDQRAFHAMAYDGRSRQIYLVGGIADSDARSYTEPQLLIGDLSGSWRVSWREVETDARGVEPGARYGAAAVFDEELGLIVYGGRGLSDEDLLDANTYVLEGAPGSGFQWRILAPGDVIGGRWGHSMLLDKKNRRLFVVGGRTSTADSGDVFMLELSNPKEWAQIDLPGGGIPPRTGHSTGIATIGSQSHLVVLGGIDDCSVRSDAWLISISDEESPRVIELEMPDRTVSSRAFAATGQFGILQYMFGGVNEHWHLQGIDVVEFVHLLNTIESGEVKWWSEDSWGGPPPRRLGAGLTFLEFAHPGLMFALVGGLGEDEPGAISPLSDTWLYQEPGDFLTAPAWTPYAPTATPVRPELHGAVGPLLSCSTSPSPTVTAVSTPGDAILIPIAER